MHCNLQYLCIPYLFYTVHHYASIYITYNIMQKVQYNIIYYTLSKTLPFDAAAHGAAGAHIHAPSSGASL